MFAVHSKSTIESGRVGTPIERANQYRRLVKTGQMYRAVHNRARAYPRAENEPEVAALGWIRPLRDAARLVVPIVEPESGRWSIT